MEENLDNLIISDWERSIGFAHEQVMPEELASEAPTFEQIVDKGTQLGKEMGKGGVGALMPGEWERLGRALVYAVAPDAEESRVDAFLRGIEEDPTMYSAEDFYQLVGETEGPLSEEAKQVGQVMGSLFAPGGIIAGLVKKGKAMAKPAAMATAIGATAASPTAQGAVGVYNNPGNVEATEGWAGDTGERYGENDRFAVFDSPEMGLRALMRDVRTKIRDSKGSIRQMITKYAPPNENPTEKYIAYVEKAVGKKKAALKDAPAITKAILEFENKPSVREYYLTDPKIFETASKLSTKAFPAGTTFEQAKKIMGITSSDSKSKDVPIPGFESLKDMELSSIDASPDKQVAGVGKLAKFLAKGSFNTARSEASKDLKFVYDDIVDEIYRKAGETDLEVIYDPEIMDTFSPDTKRLLKALEKDNFLGFDGPLHALRGLVEEGDEAYEAWELSPQLKGAITNSVNKKMVSPQ